MLNFLFWNLRKHNLTASIVRLAERHQVDVFVFAECVITPVDLLVALNSVPQETQFHYAPGRVPGNVEIFTRFASQSLPAVSEDTRYTIRRLLLPGRDELIIAAAHLESKLQSSDVSQYDESLNFANAIRRTEVEEGHKRTLVLGDLNMNPFEFGVISAMRLHGVSSKTIARQQERIIQGKSYDYFYNPMWNHFGDHSKGPPGTYYYRKAIHDCYFWNIFDQVLIRPALLDFWKDGDLHILTTDGTRSFLTRNGIPDKENVSDHLPILFRLEV